MKIEAANPDLLYLVVFQLDDQKFGLHLNAVDRVVHAVEVAPLPGAPEVVMGIVNYRGRVTPVVDIRKRFGFPSREIQPEDHLIIAKTERRMVGLLVDSVSGAQECPREAMTPSGTIVPGLQHLQGIAKLENGLVYIHDLETFLSFKEEASLEEALKHQGKTACST